MRNQYFCYLALVPLFFSCTNNNRKEELKTDEPEIENVDDPVKNTKKGKKVTDRNYNIGLENAFNDVFLDSMAMENYISQNQLGEKKIGLRIRSFYNARNYQYAWFSSKGLTEQTRFFWNQYDYAVTHLKDTTLANTAFYKQAESLVNKEVINFNKKDASLLHLEFAFTENLIRYINSTYEKGYVKRKEQEKFIPVMKLDPLKMADSLLNKKHSDDKYYEEVNDMYAGLKKVLPVYLAAARTGGWPEIPTIIKSLSRGDRSPALPLIKRRLQLTGDMPGNDSTDIFTDTLEMAVREFETRLGYTPDGVIGKQLILDLNVPAKEKLKQLLLNMDRMRWMPQKPTGNLIIVNIPEFILHVMDGKNKVFDMVVVVGKVGHNTMMFNGDLNQVIFSPYWNIPQSIIKNEILPAIKRNPNYLVNKNMERIGNSIRQKPGPGNALGKVKFIFPNSFNMYFHDTPAKSLFERDKRAFSHGCIRLSDPQKMAEWVLRNESIWTKTKIINAMNQKHETAVRLQEAIPVFIIYYTAWVDSEGRLNFRDDVYDHDKEVMKKMFTE